MSTSTITTETKAPTSASQKIDKKLGIKTVPFVLMHLACLAVIFTGISLPAVLLCIGLYLVRMWGLTAGYHRYFSHRSYKTSRGFQFLLALLGTTAAQKGPLWWAAHHRRHHKYTDQEGDVHSPRQNGFWWSHVGWVVSDMYDATDWEAIKDFSRYPELRWLNRWHLIPPTALGALCFLALGWEGLVVGFFTSTVILYHGTFSINSLAHMWGSRRYKTGDDSRNNLWLALLTGGEGWHNNHHHYMASANQGFYWWEIDYSYYVLRVLSWLRVVWDLRRPPAHLFTATEAE